MARKPKKGQSGAAVGFMTRGQAIRKLQVSLSLFRKLCILKGVYPREPSKKVRGKDKTYYYSKDILFLAHDPILSKFRQEKTWRKRMAKAKGRKENAQTIKRIISQRPNYRLDHIVRERYPTFIDALRDLDDALCVLFFFATLPNTSFIPPSKTANCRKLCLEFQRYIIQAKCLKKVFVSIKGIYYQAEIMGQLITWIVPFQFNMTVPKEVDFRIMRTFSDFYETLLGFVNFKLYHSLGLHYPPSFDPTREDNGESLFSVIVSQANRAIKEKESEEDDEEENIQGEEERKVFQSGNDSDEKNKNLFSGLYFYLSREVPKYSLEFVIRCFGGEVSWESPSAPYNENFEKITHQVVDRPSIQTLPYRTYIQPQWVYDSINAGLLLPTEDYAIDATLPPHLSPFVDYEKEGYMPKRAEEIKAIVEASKGNYGQSSVSSDGFDEVEDDDESDEEERYQQELRAEKEGTTPASSTPSKKVVKAKLEEIERKKFAEMMIPNKKKRRLYQKIQYSKQRKLQQNQNLLNKRKLAEARKNQTA